MITLDSRYKVAVQASHCYRTFRCHLRDLVGDVRSRFTSTNNKHALARKTVWAAIMLRMHQFTCKKVSSKKDADDKWLRTDCHL